MTKSIRVRVKDGKRGFIYGTLRIGATHSDKGRLLTKADEFTLIPTEYTHKKDDNGDPLIKTPEQQFSSAWMERLDKQPAQKPENEPDSPTEPEAMTVKELKIELVNSGIDFPKGAKKAELAALLDATVEL